LLSKRNFNLLLLSLTIICAIINLGYFVSKLWDRYAISTDRDGIGYNFYIHMKDIEKEDILYHLDIILVSSFLIMLVQLTAIINRNVWLSIFSILLFTLFLIGLNEYNIYLGSKWVGKG
jgi:hypothetical protein